LLGPVGFLLLFLLSLSCQLTDASLLAELIGPARDAVVHGLVSRLALHSHEHARVRVPSFYDLHTLAAGFTRTLVPSIMHACKTSPRARVQCASRVLCSCSYRGRGSREQAGRDRG